MIDHPIRQNLVPGHQRRFHGMTLYGNLLAQHSHQESGQNNNYENIYNPTGSALNQTAVCFSFLSALSSCINLPESLP